MNYIFFVFLIFCGVLIFLSLRDLVAAIKQSKRPVDFRCLPDDAKAGFLVKLIASGYFLKHTVVNDSPPRDDKRHIADYTSFLDAAAVSAIRKLKGRGPNGQY